MYRTLITLCLFLNCLVGTGGRGIASGIDDDFIGVRFSDSQCGTIGLVNSNDYKPFAVTEQDLANGYVYMEAGAMIVTNGGESSLTEAGRMAHQNYKNALPPGYKFNKAISEEIKLRPDAVDLTNRIVRELKPATESGIKQGIRQLNKYASLCCLLGYRHIL